MRAAGLNPVDIAIGAGRFYGDVPDPPLTLGAEIVGEVLVSDSHRAGTRVWALTTTGAFAEQCCVPDDHLIPVPDGIDDVTAAALGIAGCAGWMSVAHRADLAHGETVLVLAATGVVGQIAVQAARRLGAGTIVAAGRPGPGLARLAELGADHVVSLSGDGVGDRMRRACSPGADVIIDMAWGPILEQALGVASPGARVVQVGNAASPTATIPGGTLRGGRIDIRGFSVFAETVASLTTSYHALVSAHRGGAIVIDLQPMPLADAAAAWKTQITGTEGRKLVIVNT